MDSLFREGITRGNFFSSTNPIGAGNCLMLESPKQLKCKTCIRSPEPEWGVFCRDPLMVKSILEVIRMENPKKGVRERDSTPKEEDPPYIPETFLHRCGIQLPVRSCYTSSRHLEGFTPIVKVGC